jgi:hypothetical protein
MKKIIFIIVLASATTCMFPSCSGNATKTTEQTAAEKVVYTCPMHPEVTSDKPGTCPKCGMDLVKKEANTDKSKTNQ